MAEEFSRTALEKYRKHGTPLRCKHCVAWAEQREREAAAAKRQDATAADASNISEMRVCASCQTSKSATEYNKNEWNKGEGVGRCRACVERSVADEKTASEAAKSAKLEAAAADVQKAKASGNAAAILKAESVLSALQAEKVTGLKPVRMNRGGGGRRSARGRGRGSGRK